MNILVIQTAFIGDVVLTTPFIQCLLDASPRAEIHFVGTQPGCDIVEGLERVHVHVLDKSLLWKGLKEVQQQLNGISFDVVYSVHRSLRSLWLGRKVSAKKRVGFDSVWARLLGYETKTYPPYDEKIHYADKPMRLLDHPTQRTPRPNLVVSLESQQSIEKVLPFKNYIVLSPFSIWGTKMWLSDRFAELGVQISEKYKLPIVVIGAKIENEIIIGETIADRVRRRGVEAKSLVGKTTVAQLKAVIKGARLIVSNDSAPIHIAAAFNIPTVAIFGPTVKKWGFFPLSDVSAVVEHQNLNCRPCGLHGPQVCPERHFRCMKEVTVKEVFDAVEKVISP